MKSTRNFLELVTAQFDAKIAVMNMDVFFHIEEQVPMARPAQDVAAIQNFLDDTHDDLSFSNAAVWRVANFALQQIRRFADQISLQAVNIEFL